MPGEFKPRPPTIRRTIRKPKPAAVLAEQTRPTDLDLKRPIFPKPSGIPTGFPPDTFDTDIEELKFGADDAESRDRREVQEALDAIGITDIEDDEAGWEKRSHLIRLINFIAEQEAGDNLAMQSRRMIELLDKVPENEPVDPKVLSTIVNLSKSLLEKTRKAARAA